MSASSRSAARLAACAIVILAAASPVSAQNATPDNTSPSAAYSIREGLLTEPRTLETAIDFGARMLGAGEDADRKNGFYPELSSMLTGSGWISAGPGFRQWFFGDQMFFDTSAAISWRGYKMAQAQLELPALAHSRVLAGAQFSWRDLTQVSYFGQGPESPTADRTEYRLRAAEFIGYGGLRPARWLIVEAQGGYLGSPDVMRQAGTFQRGNPDTIDRFGSDPVFARDDQPGFAFGSVAAIADTRDARSYPTRGGVLRAAMSSYGDRADGAFSFRRYEGEVAQFVPLGQRLVLAFHGFMLATDADEGSIVPFYMIPSLGGGNSLRGYADYRFHDRNLLLTTVEGRLALTSHIDLAAFADAGNVAARARDLGMDKRDYGIGLRLNARQDTLARLDVAHGAEGWRFIFRTSDPLRLTRLHRRTAAAPFVQ
jgi:hypothetical protein